MGDEVERAIETVKKISCKNGGIKELEEKTLQYFLEHEDRMLYKPYHNSGTPKRDTNKNETLRAKMEYQGRKRYC